MSPLTRAILPVHLYGHPAPLEDLVALARRDGLRLLEDCAQSHGAALGERPTGTWGDAAAYSFYPTKNLGAAGDAGCVITADGELADRVRSLANHGRVDRYFHDRIGWNERLDAIQAAILFVKLAHLEAATAARRKAAARYNLLLKRLSPLGMPMQLPVEHEGARAVYHLYVVRHPRRDELARALSEAGVGTATHYPTTLPAQPAFRQLGLSEGSWPRAESWAASCLSLPLFPGINPAQQDRVVEVLASLPH
jgi:dTDP-4-amino-4,6-dideoxygalactose transaminase